MILSFSFFQIILNGSSRPVTMFFQVLYNKVKEVVKMSIKKTKVITISGCPSDSDTTTKEVFGTFVFLYQYLK